MNPIIFQFTPLREGRLLRLLMLLRLSLFQFTPLREGRRQTGEIRRQPKRYFNSRPSARGDVVGEYRVFGRHDFNSRPSARGDWRCLPRWARTRQISIHAPPRGATGPLPRTAAGDDLFQFTPLREGRRSRRHSASKSRYFNSRPSARGDGCSLRIVLMSDCISIHAPPRGATWKPCKSRSNHLFQFTPLREGRRKAQSATAWHPYFNSRPSARGDVCGKYSDNSITISIHAPPRGATARDNALPKTWSISIHAPPRGATTGMMSVSAACVFQFTPLREGRRQIHVLRQTRHISIHAPPRGATRCNRHRSYRQQISIHAPPRGATRGGKSSEGSKNFNSRPSARGDPTSSRHERRRRPFQFTPLREGRLNRALCGAPDTVFQFTPLREGRHAPERGGGTQLPDFNSRPSARGDFVAFRQRLPCKFQFTPLREGRPINRALCGAPDTFQFTPLREGRPRGRTSATASAYFNSRPSARGDHHPPRSYPALPHFNSRPSARGDACRFLVFCGFPFQFTPLREGRH